MQYLMRENYDWCRLKLFTYHIFAWMPWSEFSNACDVILQKLICYIRIFYAKTNVTMQMCTYHFLMHVCLAQYRLTSPDVVFHMHTSYVFACRTWPMSSFVSRCAQATNNFSPTMHINFFYACGHLRKLTNVSRHHLPFAHVGCMRDMIDVLYHSVICMSDAYMLRPMQDPHGDLYYVTLILT